ncbi:MAG: hypothetical protein Q8L34_05680 [Candidatus Woesearchaeota archaeon]|nr:hypothetical protein [Candidatus Woesearchaeota archaeon]
MVSVSELPTLKDLEAARHFLAVASETPYSPASYYVDKKRRALIVSTPDKKRQVALLDTSERDIHIQYKVRTRWALKVVDAYERFPVVFLLAEESQRPTEDLTERVAIMLDSCTRQQLTDLTSLFGRVTLGGYAHEFGQPLSGQNRSLTAF